MWPPPCCLRLASVPKETEDDPGKKKRALGFGDPEPKKPCRNLLAEILLFQGSSNPANPCPTCLTHGSPPQNPESPQQEGVPCNYVASSIRTSEFRMLLKARIGGGGGRQKQILSGPCRPHPRTRAHFLKASATYNIHSRA